MKLVCMTGGTADTAAAVLLQKHRGLLAERFSARFLAGVGCPQKAERPLFAEQAEPVAEGGLWAALWRLGERAGTGLTVAAERIPIAQETVEICEVLNEDPYQLPSSGEVFLCDAEYAFADGRKDAAPFCVIGHATETAARTVTIGERVRYLNRG